MSWSGSPGRSGDFTIGVAAFPEGHPESPDLHTDARVLAAKEHAGATFAITQFFFRVEDYFTMVARATEQGVTMPILPGIMPVTNVQPDRAVRGPVGRGVPGRAGGAVPRRWPTIRWP